MSAQPPSSTVNPVLDSVNNPVHPFGLPLSTVRGFMSLLICAFFWIVLLWPGDQQVKPLLAHFFLLSLVLLAFTTSPTLGGETEKSPFLPWLLRVIFVGGSVAVIGFVAVQHPERLQTRLTPELTEFQNWWGPYLACTACGFAVGLFLRFVLGRMNPVFRTLRSWLSVVGVLMLVLELGMMLVFNTVDDKDAATNFLRYWQGFEVAIVAAYFGTRA